MRTSSDHPHGPSRLAATHSLTSQRAVGSRQDLDTEVLDANELAALS